MLNTVHMKVHQSIVEKKGYFASQKRTKGVMKDPIDFVVTWVDGNDPNWTSEKKQYENNIEKKGNGIERYRDWNQFMYWFRAVEKYAPWVRRVYLVTWGHTPEWLNNNCEKLKVIRHAEFIPHKYLPTFNSIAIEMNLFRIPDLSEHFVYFNDDIYLTQPVYPEDFFENGIPKYCSVAYPLKNYGYNGPFAHQLFSVLGIINGNFNIQECIESNADLWFSKEYSKSERKYNRFAYSESSLGGMFFSHLACPFKKTTFHKVWSLSASQENDFMDDTCQHKFRTPMDVMHQVVSLWDIMEGNFIPISSGYFGKKFGNLSIQIPEIEIAFKEHKYKMVCLNDSIDVSISNFKIIRQQIEEILQYIFPEKSSFEI